jgi:hypothetical protein
MAGIPRDCDTPQVDVFISHVQNTTFVECLCRLLLRVGGAKGGHHHVPLRVVRDQHNFQGGNSSAPGWSMEQSEARNCRIGEHGYITSSTRGCIHVNVKKHMSFPLKWHSLLEH